MGGGGGEEERGIRWIEDALLPGRGQKTPFAPTVIVRRAGGGCCSAESQYFSAMEQKDGPNQG